MRHTFYLYNSQNGLNFLLISISHFATLLVFTKTAAFVFVAHLRFNSYLWRPLPLVCLAVQSWKRKIRREIKKPDKKVIYSMRQSLAEPKPLWEVSRLIYAPWILDNVWNVVNNILHHLYQPISYSMTHKKLYIKTIISTYLKVVVLYWK